MTIGHHPGDPLLAAFAAGTLDLGQHITIATHLVQCARCRAWADTVEHIGGAVLDALPPSPLAADAQAQIMARLDSPAPQPAAPLQRAGDLTGTPGLPPFVRDFSAGKWSWVAPGLDLRRIQLPAPSPTRVFLLRAAAGTKLLPHTHEGFEMTCVLAGSFHHDGKHYRPGDFDFGDSTVEHDVVIDAEEPCVCLIAMQGELKLKGLLGALVQPFVSL